MTHTVFGQCPNCGAAKEASRLPASPPIPRGGFWSELDDLVAIGLIVAPITVLLVLGAVFVAPEIALVAVVLIVGYALLRQFFEIW